MMTQTEAQDFIVAHAVYARAIYRMSVAALRIRYGSDLAVAGIEQLYGGPGTKDELATAIIALRYPPASLRESGHVLYHRDGITNDVCAWCHPDPCPACGAIDTCDWTPELGAVVNGRHVTA